MSRHRLLKVSPSKLTTWLDCPRSYRLQYVDWPRPERPPQRAILSVGNSAHAALSRFWDLPLSHRVPARVADLVAECWQPVGFRNEAHSQDWRGRVTRWVVDYLREVDRTVDPVASERTVAMPTATLAVEGRVDRVDDRGGALVVVDYKTGRGATEPGTARTSLALGLYALAVARMWRRPCHRVELHHLPSGTVEAHAHTAESLARKLAEAESIGADLQAALDRLGDQAVPGRSGEDPFPARPSALCTWCPVQAHCPEGMRLGPPQPSWAGLDSLREESRSG